MCGEQPINLHEYVKYGLNNKSISHGGGPWCVRNAIFYRQIVQR